MLSPEPPTRIFSQEGTRIHGPHIFRRFTCSVEKLLCGCNARSRRFFLFTPQLPADVAEHAQKPITRIKGGEVGNLRLHVIDAHQDATSSAHTLSNSAIADVSGRYRTRFPFLSINQEKAQPPGLRFVLAPSYSGFKGCTVVDREQTLSCCLPNDGRLGSTVIVRFGVVLRGLVPVFNAV
jgi:hypothetical protein